MGKLSIALLACVFLLGSLPAHAQIASTEPIYLTINPEYPRAYGTVTVTVRSNNIDLYGSIVRISVNGTVVQSGSGVTSATVSVGGPGTRTTITATATNQGITYSAQKVVVPADVALIVEPVTSTHPFYKGGSLLASEGRVRLIALPDLRTPAGTPLSRENLVYTWRLGNQVLQSDSGIGKNVLNATAPIRYRDAAVTVTVSSQDQSVVAQASVLVSPVDPIVRIYRNDPLLGPDFANALSDSTVLRGTEDAFRAVPYFFSTLPSISWTVNGTVSETSKDITLRSTGNGTGSALLGVTAKTSNTFQQANSSLTVRFGEDSTGFFGL